MFKLETSALKCLFFNISVTGSRGAVRWPAFGYWLVILLFLMLIIAAWLRPAFNRPKLAGWKPVLARADAAWQAGDLHQATSKESRLGTVIARAQSLRRVGLRSSMGCRPAIQRLTRY